MGCTFSLEETLKGRGIPFKRKYVTMNNEVSLADSTGHHWQAILSYDDGNWKIKPTCSTTGIHVNKVKLDSENNRTLRDKDILYFDASHETKLQLRCLRQEDDLENLLPSKIRKISLDGSSRVECNFRSNGIARPSDNSSSASSTTAIRARERCDSVMPEEAIYLDSYGKDILDQLEMAKERLRSVRHIISDELECSICKELFNNAVSLRCSHTFCKRCLMEWKRKRNTCPICRARIKGYAQSAALDKLIERMVDVLSPEIGTRRERIPSRPSRVAPETVVKASDESYSEPAD